MYSGIMFHKLFKVVLLNNNTERGNTKMKSQRPMPIRLGTWA
jgi:hypothetical protein